MNKLKATILSLSLLSVMSGAAVAPALGVIAQDFPDIPSMYIKFIITLPPIVIILTSFIFHFIAEKISTRNLAILGLSFYILGGCFGGVFNNIYIILLFRIILGIGVGLILPLSTGLIAYFFDRSQQTKLLGYSTALNNLGGIIATCLSGLLVSINWRLSFLIYLFGLITFIMVLSFLPKAEIKAEKTKIDKENIIKIWPYMITVFLIMLTFFTIPSNFSVILIKEKIVPPSLIGVMMSTQNVFTFFTGMCLQYILRGLGRFAKYTGSILIIIAFVILSLSANAIIIVLGLICMGVGMGMLMSINNAQVAYHIEKKNITSAMALMSAMLFLGQFLSPFVTDLLATLMNIQSIRAPYYFSTMLSIILLVLISRINIRIEC